MKRSIGKKLLIKGLWALLLIALLLSASLIVVNIFKDTSSELVVEYHEMNAVQEFNLSLARLTISINKYPLGTGSFDPREFNNLLDSTRQRLSVCKEVVTAIHDPEKIKNFEQKINEVEQLSIQLFSLPSTSDESQIQQSLGKIQSIIDRLILDGEQLVSETKAEITEYTEIYETVVKHGRTTILFLGALIIIIIIILGWRLIRNITRPIKEFVIATNEIGEGNHKARVHIHTEDEFQLLAESFNEMVQSLDQTTVSRNYLDKILTNMFNALIVTNEKMLIQSVNQATLQLLNYKEEDLVGNHISKLFKTENNKDKEQISSEEAWLKRKDDIENTKILYTKSGKKKQALISCTLLRRTTHEIEGLIVVALDQTEAKDMEAKIARIRKKRLIDINEAQEEEKIRIAKDLHDGLGQLLTAISYSVSELIPASEYMGEETQIIIDKTKQQINAAIAETKNLAYDLIPIVLKDFGLITAMENLIQRANDTYNVSFSFNAFDFNDRIDARLEKTIYRITQEALNNIVKHARAKNAIIQIYRQYRMIVLVIEDDGVGFNLAEVQKRNKKGIGIFSMNERVLSFDGKITINSEKDNGTEIIVEIPCMKK